MSVKRIIGNEVKASAATVTVNSDEILIPLGNWEGKRVRWTMSQETCLGYVISFGEKP